VRQAVTMCSLIPEVFPRVIALLLSTIAVPL
jgi:hypothetical protein